MKVVANTSLKAGSFDNEICSRAGKIGGKITGPINGPINFKINFKVEERRLLHEAKLLNEPPLTPEHRRVLKSEGVKRIAFYHGGAVQMTNRNFGKAFVDPKDSAVRLHVLEIRKAPTQKKDFVVVCSTPENFSRDLLYVHHRAREPAVLRFDPKHLGDRRIFQHLLSDVVRHELEQAKQPTDLDIAIMLQQASLVA